LKRTRKLPLEIRFLMAMTRDNAALRKIREEIGSDVHSECFKVMLYESYKKDVVLFRKGRKII
jgi:hypothetical protein